MEILGQQDWWSIADWTIDDWDNPLRAKLMILVYTYYRPILQVSVDSDY